MDERKRCTGCGETLHIFSFPRYSSKTERRRSKCYGCDRARRIERRIERGLRRPDPAPGHKHCAGCGADKPLDEFYVRVAGVQGGKTHGRCRECVKAENISRARARGVRPFTPADGLYHRRKRLALYSMTLADYDRMLAAQNGVCPGCGITPEETGRAFAVDHDHSCCAGEGSCGRCVRGLLCGPCNFALGHTGDRPFVLRALAAYLTESNSPATSAP